MPLLTSRAAASVKSFGLLVVSALVSILENFSRSDNLNNLGSIKGQKWKIWRGSWKILSNKAVSDDSALNYPTATLTFTSTDVEIGISSGDPGMGAVFWLSDADNWWAAAYKQQEQCQTCSNCDSWNTQNCNSWNTQNCSQSCGGNCAAWNCVTNPCTAWNCVTNFCATECNCTVCNARTAGPCTAWGSVCSSRGPGACNAWGNKGACNAWGIGSCLSWSTVCNARNNPCIEFGPSCCSYFCDTTCSCSAGQTTSCTCNSVNAVFCCGFNPSNCNSFNESTCNSFFSFDCNCQINHKISIFKSISSTVSEVSSSFFTAAINSFKTILNSNSITIQAFSNYDFSSQIGSDFITNSVSENKTNRHGIIKSPSEYQQGNSIKEFRVN